MAGLDKSDYDRNYSDKELLRRIIGYFRPYKLHMFFVIFVTALGALTAALVPVYIAGVLDGLKDGLSENRLRTLVLLVLGAGIFSFILNIISQELTARAVQGTVVDLRQDAFNALLERDMSFFDEQPTGRLASRVANDTNDFGQTVIMTSQFVGQLFVFFFMIAFLSVRSLKLTILVLLFAPVIMLATNLYRRIARSISLASARILAKVNALIQETNSGIYVAKSFRAEESIYSEFSEMNDQSFWINLKKGWILSSIWPVVNVLFNLAVAAIVYFGGVELLHQESVLTPFFNLLPGADFTIGEWFLFLLGLWLIFFPLMSIASFWSVFQQGLAASERVFSMIDSDNKVVQYDNQIIQDFKGEMEFRNLNFGYSDDIIVLENFNLHIKAGEKVAIVGHTGAGKSTIAKLISRFYEYQDGELLIDNYNIRSLDLENYRKKLSLISQEVFLWNASIRDNLLYGVDLDDTKAEEKLQDVLKQVKAMDWIERLEDGINTIVGERGSLLSMGQRQLIAFARILLRDPAILIMDEATASVDPFTEVKIQNATDIILQGRTSIIIAHRLSTIRKCDRIIVLKEGKIIEEGNHEDLLSQGGHYAELYDTYYRHQSLEYIESLAD